MKAIGFYQFLPVENPESLVEVELPDPEPGARDLLVLCRSCPRRQSPEERAGPCDPRMLSLRFPW